MKVLAIGTIAFDEIETPFGRRSEVLGGSGTHFASAASYWAPVALAAVVGEDFSLPLLDFLKKRGVDLSAVKVCKGKTFRWAGRYGYDLNTRQTLKTELGVIADFSPDIPAALRNPDCLFLGNIHPALQLKVLEETTPAVPATPAAPAAPGKVFLDTMNLWIEKERETLEKVIRRSHLLVINEEEARQFSRETAPLQAARKIHSIGPQTVVIKRGEYGALLFHKGEVFSAPGLPLEEIKDPTGAGDCFAGGLTGYLARAGRYDFETLKKGVIAGSVMASFNVEDFGCNRLMDLTPEEIRGRIMEFRRLSDFGKVEI